MIRIDLRHIPILVINLFEDHRRRRFMSEQLNLLGLNHHFISAVKCVPTSIGTTLSHLKALKQKEFKPPFLILEDDCRILPHEFCYCYELPDHTDGLYLGHSIYGLKDEADQYDIHWEQRVNVKFSHFNKDFIRIYNMLALHAVLYVSKNYVNSAIQANLQALLHYPFTIPGDFMYAKMQAEHLVLAVKEVNFYQDEQYGGKEAATRNSILASIEPIKTKP